MEQSIVIVARECEGKILRESKNIRIYERHIERQKSLTSSSSSSTTCCIASNSGSPSEVSSSVFWKMGGYEYKYVMEQQKQGADRA